MASKFMSDMPLAGMEAQMQQVPGFKPRKGGMSVSRLELTQARGDRSGKAEGQGKCGSPGGSSQKDFVIGLIEKALKEAEAGQGQGAARDSGSEVPQEDAQGEPA